jgi:hypothetical protein
MKKGDLDAAQVQLNALLHQTTAVHDQAKGQAALMMADILFRKFE